jgi:hypothetical protein
MVKLVAKNGPAFAYLEQVSVSILHDLQRNLLPKNASFGIFMIYIANINTIFIGPPTYGPFALD